MGYTRSWIPPTIPQRDDLTAWKALFTDVHDSLLLSGWTQTATAGQLVIADVATLPNDDTYAGFREYAWNDAWQATAPVVLQLFFGCGIEGFFNNYARPRTPNLKTKVYFFGAKVAEFSCPQSFYDNGVSTKSALTTPGYSLLCNHPDRGFFGVVYGAGSRNRPWADGNGYAQYYGATWSLFLQRYLNDSGGPSDAGLAIYCPNLAYQQLVDNLWTSGNLPRSLSISAPKVGSVISRDNLAPRVKRVGDGSDGQRIFVEPIYYYDGIPKPHPHLVSYLNTDIAAGNTFLLTTALGVPSTFVALGNETCLSPGIEEYQRAGVAMLFE